jgi:glycosyltransferase involved in cell wall biosynthesis
MRIGQTLGRGFAAAHGALRGGMVVVETHPVQYHAPVYRELQQRFGVPVTVVYGSDFSISGYHDREFDTTFAWDTDLMSGYTARFLSRAAEGGARSGEEVRSDGLLSALRRLRPAVVLCVGYSLCFYRRACWSAWRAGLPLLFRAETTDHATVRGPLKCWLRDRALKWFYRRCARLLYVGRRSLEHYQRLGCPPERLVFSPYCVDTAAWATQDADRAALRGPTRRSLGVAVDQRVVLASGKLVPRKGPDLLVRAVKELPREARDRTVVVFLGHGPMCAELAGLAEQAPAVATRFLGFQNQRELSRYYHAADVLVLASRVGETWGLVVNEALHHGLPSVVSDQVGCAPDLIEPGVTGEVFRGRPDDPAALMQALQRGLAYAGRAEVRARCSAKVERYSVTAAAEGLAEAYRAVRRAGT